MKNSSYIHAVASGPKKSGPEKENDSHKAEKSLNNSFAILGQGGASLETFSGEAQLKNHPLILCVTLSALDRDETNIFDKLSCYGISFGSHLARCKAKNQICISYLVIRKKSPKRLAKKFKMF